MSFLKTRLFNHLTLASNNFFGRDLLETTSKLLQVRYAARKGTRERKMKKKVKVEIQKIGFIPHNQRNREKFLASREKLKFDDSQKADPLDDVFVMKYYKWVVYPFAEALLCHRESHHPDIYNKPNANLHATIELNMQGEKKTRFVDNFSGIAPIEHQFDHGEARSVIAFGKDLADQELARSAGAQMAGGQELIKQIQTGAVNLADYQHIIAHPNILTDLVVLRGLMKRKFPSPKAGTLHTDLDVLVKKFLYGISFKAAKDEYEKDYGKVEAVIGTLPMEPYKLEENFACLVQEINKFKPKREGSFITRCLLWSPPSSEKLKVDHEIYLASSSETKEDQDEETEVAAV